MNTFVAKISDGSKIDCIAGRIKLGGLNPDYEAKYCTCDSETTNISEIADWETAEDVSYEVT